MEKRDYITEKLMSIVWLEQLKEELEKRHYAERIIKGLYEKKLSMIEQATTIAELDEIKKPSAPSYYGGKWVISKYMPLEEEAIKWSETSLIAPLVDYACERYMAIMKQLFPEYAESIG